MTLDGYPADGKLLLKQPTTSNSSSTPFSATLLTDTGGLTLNVTEGHGLDWGLQVHLPVPPPAGSDYAWTIRLKGVQ